MTNILLCGGSGTRLWPLSRELYPKQFCNLIGNHSLFQLTLLRNYKLFNKTIIVTNIEHYMLAKEQVEELSIENVEYILEPIGRNTAPAITIACLSVARDDIVFVTPSDHYIGNEENYATLHEKAKIFSENNFLVTFGIKPLSPETGYGYIETNDNNVISFHEKPNIETAKKYLDAGNYYWNSGMFVFKAGVFLDEIMFYSKEIFDSSFIAYENREIDKNVIKISIDFMQKIPSDSIDYAVMEKSKKIKILTSDIGWSDIGSFEAIYNISKKDENGNASSLKNVLLKSKNNLIISYNRLITLIDIEDLIVIETSDAILISKKGSSSKIKELISNIKEINPNFAKIHSR